MVCKVGKEARHRQRHEEESVCNHRTLNSLRGSKLDTVRTNNERNSNKKKHIANNLANVSEDITLAIIVHFGVAVAYKYELKNKMNYM